MIPMLNKAAIQFWLTFLLTVKTEVLVLNWLNSAFFLGYIHRLDISMGAKLIKYNTDFSFLLAIFVN